ncbi:hypothetical protein VNO77_16601 [Canavalia gladiata]|uniref:Uncharacterized protein n=1 Tax=Canavalia gladiata TaxID=3824 RepID=A0AAN9LHF3_CANGL
MISTSYTVAKLAPKAFFFSKAFQVVTKMSLFENKNKKSSIKGILDVDMFISLQDKTQYNACTSYKYHP